MDAILRLEVVDKIEAPVHVDDNRRLGERQALTGCGWVSNQDAGRRIGLDPGDRPFAPIARDAPMDGNRAVSGISLLKQIDVLHEGTPDDDLRGRRPSHVLLYQPVEGDELGGGLLVARIKE